MRVACAYHEDPAHGGTYDEIVLGEGHELVRWLPFLGAPAPDLDEVDALVVFGGAVHPDADGTDPWLADEVALISDALGRGTPTLGICLGAQLIARAAGAWVGPAPVSEVGWYAVTPNAAGLADPIVGTLGGETHAFEWHHYTYAVPDGAVELATSARTTQAFRLGERAWGVQFHPEVTREMVYEWSSWAPDQIDGEPEDMRAETDRRIVAWNGTGRDLCLAFLAQAAT